MTPLVDVNCFVGAYPFRHVPHPEPDILARVLEREGISEAWVGHLPSAFHRDPSHGNAELFAALADYPRLRPTPAIRPDWPGWDRRLADAVSRGVPAVRAYPAQWGMGPDDVALRHLASACAEARTCLLLTVRFEDLRQRGRLDIAGDLAAATVRQLARTTGARIVVAAAGKDFIEEVHWGLTPEEQSRVWWDISWVWGPPEDHLAHLVRTIGARRFVFGTGWPLRLVQAPLANLALLPDDIRPLSLGEVRVE